MSFPTTNQLLISLLIAGLGWVSGQALSRIDQDLRIMYAEYTLGAVDLAHISADVIRYRNTIIRSLEAENQTIFERITESLPTQRARIQHAVDRYAAAGLRVSRSGRSEEKDIQAVRESLDQYFHVASKTIDLLSQEWREGTKTIVRTGYWIVGGSFFIALLNLFLARPARVRELPSSRPEETPHPGSTRGLPSEG